jgi:hypothetical protein
MARSFKIIQKGGITREVMPQEITDPDPVSEFVGKDM